MYAVFKREFFSLLNSLMAYVAMGVFLLVAGLLLWCFPDTSILSYGYAELTGFFNLAPLLFLFLVPALTMRAFAEERREGTYILLASRPLTDWQIITGKYLACVLLMALSLLPTLIYVYTLLKLGLPEGNLDTGATLGAYLGLLLLGSIFTAIGVFASSLTRNQVIAFALAVLLCFFFWNGFGALSQLFAGSATESALSWLSVSTHYQSMGRGVLDTRDLVYFITLNLCFLGLTRLVIGGRQW